MESVEVEELSPLDGMRMLAQVAALPVLDEHDRQIRAEMFLPFVIGLPWKRRSMSIVQLRHLRPGTFICPVTWEAERRRTGDAEVPLWAVVMRTPSTVRVLPPGAIRWQFETRVSVMALTGGMRYYTGHPDSWVRIAPVP